MLFLQLLIQNFLVCLLFTNMVQPYWFTDKKLSSTCYLILNIKPYLSISTLKITYHFLLHSIMSYGIIFWENSSHSSVIFKMQKRVVIRVIMGCGYRESCRELFKELKILPLSSQYIFTLLLLVVYKGLFCFK